jgi:hypothetical protein
MRRSLILTALIALLAALLSASPSLAHGGKQHAAHSVSAGPQAAVLAVEADDHAAVAAIADAGSHPSPASECPGAEGACCTNHCCTSSGLGLEPQGAGPVFASVKISVASERPPADAAADGQLRPPCR